MAGFQCKVCGQSHGQFLRATDEIEECYRNYRSKALSTPLGSNSLSNKPPSVKAQEQITQLKADLAELRLPIKSAMHYDELTETDYEILVVDYFKVKADLTKYAGHTAECELNIPLPPGYSQEEIDAADSAIVRITGAVLRPRKCDCDYEKDKERWE